MSLGQILRISLFTYNVKCLNHEIKVVVITDLTDYFGTGLTKSYEPRRRDKPRTRSGWPAGRRRSRPSRPPSSGTRLSCHSRERRRQLLQPRPAPVPPGGRPSSPRTAQPDSATSTMSQARRQRQRRFRTCRRPLPHPLWRLPLNNR